MCNLFMTVTENNNLMNSKNKIKALYEREPIKIKPRPKQKSYESFTIKKPKNWQEASLKIQNSEYI